MRCKLVVKLVLGLGLLWQPCYFIAFTSVVLLSPSALLGAHAFAILAPIHLGSMAFSYAHWKYYFRLVANNSSFTEVEKATWAENLQKKALSSMFLYYTRHILGVSAADRI